jgi:hypothetical protein
MLLFLMILKHIHQLKDLTPQVLFEALIMLDSVCRYNTMMSLQPWNDITINKKTLHIY